MSKPLSAHRHVQTEEYGRALISPFGGYVHVPVPAPVHAAPDLARVARTTLNPTKAAAGHAEMDRRGHGAYGTGASYTFRDRVGGVMPGCAPAHLRRASARHLSLAFPSLALRPCCSQTPATGQAHATWTARWHLVACRRSTRRA